MPKMKTHRGTAKRFRVTGSGKTFTIHKCIDKRRLTNVGLTRHYNLWKWIAVIICQIRALIDLCSQCDESCVSKINCHIFSPQYLLYRKLDFPVVRI